VECPNCSTRNAAEAKFCIECGTRLTATCPNCGKPVTSDARFCAQCGTPLAAAERATPERAEAAPAATAPVAERRLVSVLFADLVGFTPLSEARDAEDVRDLLSHYFDAGRSAVERHGGTVEKFIGDALMAVWGTPTAHEDDAERAVRAALEVVDAVAAIGNDAGAPTLAARAAVLTGQAAVTLGAVGQGMVAGDLVNTASRLQSAADPGTVLVDDATRRSASQAIAFEAAGDKELKGKAEPLPAHRAIRVVARRRGAGRSDQLEPPFVGRAAELRLLKEAFHASGQERRPRLVSLIGQAGIGKSRLVWELQKYLDGITETAFWHQGRCPAYGEGVTFWALGEMIRMRAGMAEGEDENTGAPKLAAVLDQFVTDADERRWLEPAIRQLLGWQSPETDRETLFAAWRTFLERIADHGVTVLAFEDAHWADQGLLDFIEHLVDWSRDRPIVVITLARPDLFERRPTWGAARRAATAMTLEPLPAGPMRELLDGLAPGLPEPIVSRILDRAEGIPLYAVETVRMLIADARVTQTDGTYQPTSDLSQLAVPESLRALVAARLDSLDPSDRELLHAAAVLGKTFPVASLADISVREPAQVESRLRDLVRREFLTIEADPRSPERGQYGFIQALLREVAYDTLSRRERRRLHLAAARHYEASGDDDLADILAAHYLAAYRAQPEGPEGEALAAQSRVALRAAADRAHRLGSPASALHDLEEAISVTPDSRDRTALLRVAVNEAALAGRFDAAERHAAEAIGLMREVGDREGELDVTATLARARILDRRIEEADQLTKPVATRFHDLRETPAYVRVMVEAIRVRQRYSEWATALELSEQLLPLAERLGLQHETLDMLITRATCLFGVGRVWEAQATLIGAQRACADAGFTWLEVRALTNLTFGTAQDDPALAYEAARRSVELAMRYGQAGTLPYQVGNLCDSAMEAGDWEVADAALANVRDLNVESHAALVLEWPAVILKAFRGKAVTELLDRLEQSIKGSQDPTDISAYRLTRAYFALATGRFEDAYLTAEQLDLTAPQEEAMAVRMRANFAALAQRRDWLAAELERGKGMSQRVTLAELRTAEAAALAMDGRLEEAASTFREAFARLRELGVQWRLALWQLAAVGLLGADATVAQAAASEARALFERVGAVTMLNLLEAAMKPADPRQGRATEAVVSSGS
jgi:class 3 adenylate cyclase